MKKNARVISFRINDEESELIGSFTKNDLLEIAQIKKDMERSFIDLEKGEILLTGELFKKLFVKNFEKNNKLMWYFVDTYGLDVYGIKLKQIVGKEKS